MGEAKIDFDCCCVCKKSSFLVISSILVHQSCLSMCIQKSQSKIQNFTNWDHLKFCKMVPGTKSQFLKFLVSMRDLLKLGECVRCAILANENNLKWRSKRHFENFKLLFQSQCTCQQEAIIALIEKHHSPVFCRVWNLHWVLSKGYRKQKIWKSLALAYEINFPKEEGE